MAKATRNRIWTIKTYGDLANLVGEERNKPNMSAQAIGGAVGSNPISIIIPCHRVVGKDGSLTGYGGTINHKIKLLELEQVDMNNLYRPKIQLNHNTFTLRK